MNINETNAQSRPANRDRNGRPFTGKVTVTVSPVLKVDGKFPRGAVGIRLTQPLGFRSFTGEIVADLPPATHRRIVVPGLTADRKKLPLFYPDRLPSQHHPYDPHRGAGKDLARAIQEAAIGPEITHLCFEGGSIVGYCAIGDAKNGARREAGSKSRSGEAKAIPIRDAGSGPTKNDPQVLSAAEGSRHGGERDRGGGVPNAEQRRGSTTREERAAPAPAVVDNHLRDSTAHARPENRYRDGRQRGWRRIGAVLSAVTAVLACVPFGRSVSTLLQAYEAAEAWRDRGLMEAIVVGERQFTGFPGLLHASAAVLMTAVTIVLFACLALLLASDVWLPGKRNDATEANRQPTRPKAAPHGGR